MTWLHNLSCLVLPSSYDHCAKCMRQSTRSHPIDLTVVQKWECIYRGIGVAHRLLPAVFHVCGACKAFLTQPFDVRNHWSMSWQCALWDLLLDKRSADTMWIMLPASMRGWYFHSDASAQLSQFHAYKAEGLFSGSKFADSTRLHPRHHARSVIVNIFGFPEGT